MLTSLVLGRSSRRRFFFDIIGVLRIKMFRFENEL